MKYLITLILACLLGFASYSQQLYLEFANDTANGANVTNTYVGSIRYNSFITWDYTMTGNSATDTCNVVLEGSNNSGTTWYPLDSITYTGNTETNYHFLDNPAEFLRYRTVAKPQGSTDTIFFKNQLLINKR